MAVNAPGGTVYVSVSPTSVAVGQSFTIAFRIATAGIAWTGMEIARVSITTYDWSKSPALAYPHIWDSAPIMNVAPELTYRVSPPGLSTPGNNYIAVVGVDESGSGEIVALGSAYFQVVQVAPPTHVIVTSATTAATTSATTAVKTAVTHVIITSATTPFDFSLGLSPAIVTVKQGDTATFQVLISYSDPSYSGTTINIQVSGLGPGMNYQVIPSPPTLRVSTSSSTPPGSYPVTLTGSSHGVKHQANALLTVKTVQPFDFSISASPAQRTITPGASTTSTVTVGLLSGTSQNVALKVTGAPKGVSASLNPKSGTPKFSSILSITTTASAASGKYTLTITGTAGTTSHTAAFMLTVGQSPDFRIDVNPPSQTSTQGGTTTYQVSVVGLNGFNSQVTLSVSGLPSGANGVFTVTSGTPDFTSALTVTLPANAPTGPFTLIVTGAGGGVNRAANLVLNINPATQTSTQTSTQAPSPVVGDLTSMLQQNQLLILAAVILLVGAVIVASRRRKPSGPTQAAQAPKSGGSLLSKLWNPRPACD